MRPIFPATERPSVSSHSFLELSERQQSPVVFVSRPKLHQDICSATWWDSKLFNALIRPKLCLEAPGDCCMLHQQQLAPFINLMGFIFLTLTIYQAEAAWWGERGGSNSPTSASSQQGNRWFMVSLPSPITLFPSSFPITPCCSLPPLPGLPKHPYVFYQATFISPSLPVAPACTPFFTSIPSPLPPVLLLPSSPSLIVLY